MVNPSRIRDLKIHPRRGGPVIYWMGREQRASDNWALLYAQQEALKAKVPLVVCFALVPSFLDATIRQYDFMLEGLAEVYERLADKNIPMFVLEGDPVAEVSSFAQKMNASLIVCDFEPLTLKVMWKFGVSRKAKISMQEVDARNVVPCWIASLKREYGAYTIRNKIHSLMHIFREEYPRLKKHPHRIDGREKEPDWEELSAHLEVDRTVKPVKGIVPGEGAALRVMREFVRYRLSSYERDRNDPSKMGQSGLSPYLHFGHISSLTILNEMTKQRVPERTRGAFIEELVVRRELSDNFCLYTKNYESLECLPDWSKKTLAKHAKDKREYIYKLGQFEVARTHDAAWNAAQMEMVETGKMHGYMRMYWAKKLLEWTKAPSDALRIAIYLNDKYELDGRDTNGYAGILWAIGGLHDRPWGERKVFGMVRYMSTAGLKSKFDIGKYIDRWTSARG